MSFEQLPKEQQRWMRTQLTEFIGRSVIFEYRNGGMFHDRTLVAVEDLNSLDRWALAERWYRETLNRSRWYLDHFNSLICGNYGNYEAFIMDVAVYIDSRIPRAYIKYKEGLDRSLNNIRVPCNVDMSLPYGLKYQYSENLEVSLPPRQQCLTSKQEQYLVSLSKKARYIFIDRDRMSKKEATDCINYFLDMSGKSEPGCFSTYFVDANEV